MLEIKILSIGSLSIRKLIQIRFSDKIRKLFNKLVKIIGGYYDWMFDYLLISFNFNGMNCTSLVFKLKKKWFFNSLLSLFTLRSVLSYEEYIVRELFHNIGTKKYLQVENFSCFILSRIGRKLLLIIWKKVLRHEIWIDVWQVSDVKVQFRINGGSRQVKKTCSRFVMKIWKKNEVSYSLYSFDW